jgi:hypothetical protein
METKEDRVETAKLAWLDSIKNNEPEALQKALEKIYDNEVAQKLARHDKSFIKILSKDFSHISEESKKKMAEVHKDLGKFVDEFLGSR